MYHTPSYVPHTLIHTTHAHTYHAPSYIPHTLIRTTHPHTYHAPSYIPHTLIRTTHPHTYHTPSYVPHTLIRTTHSIERTVYHSPQVHSEALLHVWSCQLQLLPGQCQSLARKSSIVMVVDGGMFQKVHAAVRIPGSHIHNYDSCNRTSNVTSHTYFY